MNKRTIVATASVAALLLVAAAASARNMHCAGGIQYVVQGLKNSPLAGKVKIAGALGDISSLQRVKSGQQAYDALASVEFGGILPLPFAP